jgi:hypothetical protein
VAESTLALSYDDYMAAIADYFGFGRKKTAWTADQTVETDDTVQSGYRTFLFHGPTQLGQVQWSFLKPLMSISTVSAKSDYPLPDDYGGLTGAVTISTTSTSYSPIRKISSNAIMEMRSRNPSQTGVPHEVAVRAIRADGAQGQRWELMVWPTPDGAYTLQLPTFVLPGKLSATNQYPYGGAAHSETILASCLAAAERKRHNTQGVNYARFMELLMASQSLDGKQHRPDYLGYNGDGSDGRRHGRHGQEHIVTYNDIEWS